MAPKILYSCSVCDDDFSSVSTLHYHQMCLHTTEELSLAILSIRKLPVNASPTAGDGGSSAASPSMDCEDKLLRNGLAKYPRFLNSSRKQKVVESENNTLGHDTVDEDNKDELENTVTDKENVVQNNAVGENSATETDDKESIELKVEEDISASTENEPVRSSLWGAFKTLDGKAVDAPVIKIDKKCSNKRISKFNVTNTNTIDSSENCEPLSCEANSVSSIYHDPDSPLGKENVLEKHLKLMNMSSFDDCIELDCSEESEEDVETFITDASDDEAKMCEIKEEDGDQANELKPEICSDEKSMHSEVPQKYKCYKNKRSRGKILKHRSWYKGGNFRSSFDSKAPKSSISISKDTENYVEGIAGKSFEGQGTQAEEKKSGEMGRSSVDCGKVFADSCVQTDNFFYEEVSNTVIKMLEANNIKGSNDRSKLSHKKVSPKKNCLSTLEKDLKGNITNHASAASKEVLIPERPLVIKSEVVVLDGEKRFYCNDCAKTYKKRSHLERHKRVHTGERPFVCPYCDKGFSVRSILNQHIRIHTGEKPYACTICAARFPQKSGLMTHMMLHTGKPFKCDQCDKAFVSNHKLVHHLKSHDGDRPHVCNKCNSAFFTVEALNDHKSLHSRNRKHVCNKCNASFVHEVYLKIHLATHLLEADCENAAGNIDVGSVSPNAYTSPQSNTGQRNELTLTLDAIDQFYNGETIMMDLSV